MRSAAILLHEWTATVRKKFKLPDERLPSAEYWRGYTACLDDVDRLADRWAGQEVTDGE